MIRGDWRQKVYKYNSVDYPENWQEIRSEIIHRDNYICFRCEMIAERMGDLSVHHLLPRNEGGKENEENLITLCHPCHDIVEEAGYREKAEIIGSYEGDTVNYVVQPSPDVWKKKRTETFERPEWHTIVYGGRKRS